MKNKLLIQGDVMLRIVDMPKGLTTAKKGSEVLALGETSGHGHVLENCEVLVGADEARFVVPKKGARLLHKHLTTERPADHRELILPLLPKEKVYQVVIQNSFNPFSKIMERVID